MKALLIEPVTMPNGSQAWIHIFESKRDRYRAELVFANGNRLPMGITKTWPKNTAEALAGAKGFLRQVYGTGKCTCVGCRADGSCPT